MNRVEIVGKIYEIREAAKCSFITCICRSGNKNEFLDIVLFEQQATFFKKWFTTGQWIGITGHLKKSIRDKDGKRYSELSIIADNLEMIGPQPQQQNQGIIDDYVDIDSEELPF